MTKLGEVLDKIIGGGTPSKSKENYWNGNIPWASVKDISEEQIFLSYTKDCITEEGLKKSSSNLIPKGTVIIPTRMGLGRCVITTIDTAINQDLKALIPNISKLNSKYLLYWLKNNSLLIESMGSGTTVKGIRLEQLIDLDFKEVNIKTQQKIAKVLSNYDDLIENNNKRIKILEEMAQKIYKEWFVDFKFPNHETATFKDSELGKIPSDWFLGTIKDINDVKGGYAFKSSDLKDTGKYGVIKIKNIQSGDIDINSCQYIDERIAQKAEAFKLGGGDMLIAMTGAQVGKVGIMPKIEQHYYLNQRVGKFVPNKEYIVNNQYLSMCTSSEKFNIQINNVASGAAQPNISTSQIENIEILVPKAEILTQFETLVNPLFMETMVLKEKNAILKQTRDLLLPRLISGEIDVEDMEIV